MAERTPVDKLKSFAALPKISRRLKRAVETYANVLENPDKYYNTSTAGHKGYLNTAFHQTLIHKLQPALNPGVKQDDLVELFLTALNLYEEQEKQPSGQGQQQNSGEELVQSIDQALKIKQALGNHMEKFGIDPADVLVALTEQDDAKLMETFKRISEFLNTFRGCLNKEGRHRATQYKFTRLSYIKICSMHLAPLKLLRNISLLNPPYAANTVTVKKGQPLMLLVVDTTASMLHPKTKRLILASLLKWAEQENVKCLYQGYRSGAPTSALTDMEKTHPAMLLNFSPGDTYTISFIRYLTNSNDYKQAITQYGNGPILIFTDDEDYYELNQSDETFARGLQKAGTSVHIIRCGSSSSIYTAYLGSFAKLTGGQYLNVDL